MEMATCQSKVLPSKIFRQILVAGEPKIDPHTWYIILCRFSHENISTAILPLLLIQEEQLSVNEERMCTKQVG